MNDNDLRNDMKNNNTYHATKNLNTAIENPQINMNSAVDVNIQDIDNNGSRYNTNYMINQDFVANNSFDNIDSQIKQSQFQANVDINVKQIVDNQTLYNANIADELNTAENFSITDSEQKNVIYEPTLKQKKNPDSGFKLPREFKLMVVIVMGLFLVICIIPYIYDLFINL